MPHASCEAVAAEYEPGFNAALEELTDLLDCADFRPLPLCTDLDAFVQAQLLANRPVILEAQRDVADLLANLMPLKGGDYESMADFEDRLYAEFLAAGVPLLDAGFGFGDYSQYPLLCDAATGNRAEWEGLDQLIDATQGLLTFVEWLADMSGDVCEGLREVLQAKADLLYDQTHQLQEDKNALLHEFFDILAAGSDFYYFSHGVEQLYHEARYAGEIPVNPFTVHVPSHTSCLHVTGPLARAIADWTAKYIDAEDCLTFAREHFCGILDGRGQDCTAENQRIADDLGPWVEIYLQELQSVLDPFGAEHADDFSARLTQEFTTDVNSGHFTLKTASRWCPYLPDPMPDTCIAIGVTFDGLEATKEEVDHSFNLDRYLVQRVDDGREAQMHSCEDLLVELQGRVASFYILKQQNIESLYAEYAIDDLDLAAFTDLLQEEFLAAQALGLIEEPAVVNTAAPIIPYG